MPKKKIGLLINPISGMGGSVGLKGTDGLDILEKALSLGAKPLAPSKTKFTLDLIKDISDNLEFYTGSGSLGEDILKELNYDFKVIYKTENENTISEDSIALLNLMKDEKLDLILFAGGDGTARIVCEILGTEQVSLGIPTGVKIHSGVFAINPKRAGMLVKKYLEGEIKTKYEEVVDLDEEFYRQGKVMTSLYGYLKVPYKETLLQNKKAPSPGSEEKTNRSIALYIVDYMKENEDYVYLVGAGSTTSYIMKELGLEYTLLGVDVIKNQKLLKLDANEREIEELIKGEKVKLVVSPTGGQGFLFGRGNQQLSPNILKYIGKANVNIISRHNKIIQLKGNPLLIDTASQEVNEMLSGYYKIRVGYKDEIIYKATY